MTPQEIQLWVSIVTGLISIGTAGFVFLTAGSRDNTVAIKKLEERLLELDQRAARVETDIRHMPSKDGVQRMEITLAEMNGKIAVLGERLTPIAEMAHRVHERMFEEAKR